MKLTFKDKNNELLSTLLESAQTIERKNSHTRVDHCLHCGASFITCRVRDWSDDTNLCTRIDPHTLQCSLELKSKPEATGDQPPLTHFLQNGCSLVIGFHCHIHIVFDELNTSHVLPSVDVVDNSNGKGTVTAPSGNLSDGAEASPRAYRKSPLNHDPQSVTWARNAKNLSKKELAELAGISLSLMCEIEGGTRNATPKNLAKIAQALNCPITTLERKCDYHTDREAVAS